MKGFLGRGAVIGVCCLGCGFDSTGSTAGATLGSHETSESTSDSPATASNPMTTEPGGSDRDDGDTSDPTETMGATDDPMVDPSETDTSKDTDSTSTTDDDTETTGVGFEPYSACPCIDGEESCYEFNSGQVLVANVCYAVPCASDSDCPPAPGGTATPICVMAGNGFCGLNCANRATCPDGMTCYAIQNDQFRCAWPVQ